jgi:hypothetical protein
MQEAVAWTYGLTAKQYAGLDLSQLRRRFQTARARIPAP